VLREVKKKLKRDGLFIVIDVYQRDRVMPFSRSEDIMLKLIAKCVSVDKIECVKDVECYMQEEYSIIAAKDYSQYVLPSMIKLESLVSFYFDHPAFAKAVNSFVPFDIVKNAISVYLLPISVRRQTGCYFIHVLKQDMM
jgi:hypothetical protein